MNATQIADKVFLEIAPKAELHLHVEETIDPVFLFEMAARNHVVLPYDRPEDVLTSHLANKKGSTENLKNFLRCLDQSRGAIRTSKDYFDISTQMMTRRHKENVVYAEVFFDPQQGMRKGGF